MSFTFLKPKSYYVHFISSFIRFGAKRKINISTPYHLSPYNIFIWEQKLRQIMFKEDFTTLVEIFIGPAVKGPNVATYCYLHPPTTYFSTSLVQMAIYESVYPGWNGMDALSLTRIWSSNHVMPFAHH